MIWLVRHGQTVFNAEGRFQGHSDSPLTRLGERQARQTGLMLRALLKDAPSPRMVSSPLGRTRHTASLIAETMGHDGEIEFDHRLAEVTMGQWDGMTGEDIDFAYPGVRDGLTRFEWWFHAPGGESLAVFSTRLADWLTEAAASPEPIIAVSHGGVSKVLRGLYLGLSKEKALALESPQDAIFCLDGDEVEQIMCGAADQD